MKNIKKKDMRRSGESWSQDVEWRRWQKVVQENAYPTLEGMKQANFKMVAQIFEKMLSIQEIHYQ